MEQDRAGGGNGQTPDDLMVVGLGASAGGLKALQQFFGAMPSDSGMAFVVILHLSPNHESHAADILQNSTQMTVTQVTEAVSVEPNRVYVIPPSQHLAMRDGIIALSDPNRPQGRPVAVDLFFSTLAETHGTRAICIVLSGTGADGAVGIRRVKEMGGITIAQDPGDAEYDSMPRHAINTGAVDFALPVAEMPELLLTLWHNAHQIQLPREAGTPKVDESHAAEQALRDALTLVRTRTGHDFTHYKRATVLRRIERRMQVTATPNLPAYRDHLRETAIEASLLLQDLLIGVTNFFRDRQSFDALEREVIPLLFENKGSNDRIRVWVAGCASGEEAYSIAILLLEHAARLSHPPSVQVFATDIDETAIATARTGKYPEAIEADVAPVHLRQFFTKEGNDYHVNERVRECVLFAPHNLIKDPPFSHLDLVTCRNLLIYLNRDVQEQIFLLFHFALRPNGFLFLGSSESVDGTGDLFLSLDKRHRLFRHQASTRRPRAALPTLPIGSPPIGRLGPHAVGTVAERQLPIVFGALHQRLLERYAPPSILINAAYEIVHLSEHAGRFVRLAGGEPSLNLLKVVLPELRAELSTTLFQAFQTGRSTEAHLIPVERDADTGYINLIVRPETDLQTNEIFALVLFDEAKSVRDQESRDHERDAATHTDRAEPAVHSLEEEAQRLRTQLQTTTDQYEIMVEETKASNEELQAINEEFRATSEEMETSKEELQSVNEELRTVNDELKNKIQEVTESNNDLRNLMASTEIATIFLDRSLLIKRYTPRALEIFSLIPADEGRSLSNITHQLRYDDLLRDAEAVLSHLQSIEREVASREGHHYLVNMVPYCTTDDRISGVVINFVDITARKQAEEALRELSGQLEERVRERTSELGRAIETLRTEVQEHRATDNTRKELLRRLVTVQEEERHRLSRELHDQMGQHLTGLLLGLDTLKSAIMKNPPATDLVERLQKATSQLSEEVHHLTWDLRPPALDDLGLDATLMSYVQTWEERHGIAADFHSRGWEARQRLPFETETTLYRIVQEALNNVVRHAAATRVSVVLERRDVEVLLIMEDNGDGFDTATLQQAGSAQRLGLRGIQERAAILGGTLNIESSPDQGTTLFIRFSPAIFSEETLPAEQESRDG